MLKILALSLLVATFIASGFAFAPVKGARTGAAETLAIADAASHVFVGSGVTRSLKRDREATPSS